MADDVLERTAGAAGAAAEPAGEIHVARAEASDDGKSLVFLIKSSLPNATGTTVRTFAQVQQLHQRISDAVKAVLIPVLPEAPNTAMVRDKTHAEKKRRQVERYLSRVAARRELRDLPDVIAFLTDQPLPVAAPAAAPAAPKKSLFSALGARYDAGFRIYRPTLNIDDEEEVQFDKRRMYILQSERDHQEVLAQIAAVIRARSAHARQLATVGSLVADLDGEERAYNGAWLVVTEAAGRVAAAVKDQVRDEVYHFGDVLLEYRNQSASFKTLLNNRTDVLADMEAAVKASKAQDEQLAKLRRKFPETSHEVQQAIAQAEKAKETAKELRARHNELKVAIHKEYELADAQRVRDYRVALDAYVRVHIDAEQTVLAALLDAQRALQGLSRT